MLQRYSSTEKALFKFATSFEKLQYQLSASSVQSIANHLHWHSYRLHLVDALTDNRVTYSCRVKCEHLLRSSLPSTFLPICMRLIIYNTLIFEKYHGIYWNSETCDIVFWPSWLTQVSEFSKAKFCLETQASLLRKCLRENGAGKYCLCQTLFVLCCVLGIKSFVIPQTFPKHFFKFIYFSDLQMLFLFWEDLLLYTTKHKPFSYVCALFVTKNRHTWKCIKN